MEARLHCNGLTVSVAGQELVKDLQLDIEPGSFVCVLGTNGVGKTLTLHTLAGLRPPATGDVTVCGDSLSTLARKDAAVRLGLLLQIYEDAFPLSVMDMVLMGRYPRLSLWRWPDDRDLDAARKALQKFDLAGLEDRVITTLSGGERERVALATLQVQDPAIWLLDEPMNHLDPHHQLSVLDILKETACNGRVILTTLHNPAMAVRYADHALLLYGDGEWEYGTAAELLEPARLERLYQTPFDYYRNTQGERTLLMPA
ncbi:MAG: ABC transporter ATP-binding protein [Gammaproteobacteria bacterium]|jgi:iron complex transport system ATP-binding protein|nr:ABC transporter ATP-binding protein [Gammaproteobacteria bacterium]MDP6617149.1 ABC transporter ATP-binding protein [Gammaproteobacteria bacterium]MDP6695358.1 ABC transporter ATP-binding protein [Gammaproteobacteria bacterium]